MSWFLNHILSSVIFLPLLGVLLLAFIPKEAQKLLKGVSLSTALLTFILSLGLFLKFNVSASLQFVEKAAWIPSFGVSYFVGVDGISLFLVLLTTFLTPLVVLYAFSQEKSKKAYLMLILALETAMVGTFAALDLFLFYIFWEAMLIPMYFMIGVWGGERRLYATIKFLLYTIFGSFLMLVALIAVVILHFQQTNILTTDLLVLYGTPFGKFEIWLFLGFALAFLIKVPLFPFHTWLPDAHVEAPTEGSVILAAVLLKMGVYGLIRFAIPLFPNATLQAVPWILVLSLIGIIYGACLAWAQTDLKKLVAYSSVSHLGYAVLGLFVLNQYGATGSIIQLLSHGFATGGLFFIVGMIYKRAHTKEIAKLGGLASTSPRLLLCFMIMTLASVGLPLTSGFVGEFLSLFGAFQAYATKGLSEWAFGTLGVLGVLLGAIYMFGMFQKVMFGPKKFVDFKDLSVKEVVILTPLMIMIFWIGVYPKTFTEKIDPSVTHFVNNFYKYTLAEEKSRGPSRLRLGVINIVDPRVYTRSFLKGK